MRWRIEKAKFCRICLAGICYFFLARMYPIFISIADLAILPITAYFMNEYEDPLKNEIQVSE